MGIAPQHLLHLQRQAVHAAAHVGVAPGGCLLRFLPWRRFTPPMPSRSCTRYRNPHAGRSDYTMPHENLVRRFAEVVVGKTHAVEAFREAYRAQNNCHLDNAVNLLLWSGR